MTNEEVQVLVDQYFKGDGYVFPGGFEHRLDPDSSAVMYSFIRDKKPTTALSIGTWEGGSACIIESALQMNDPPFQYYASELLDDKRENTRLHVLEKCGKTPIMLGDITKSLSQIPQEIDFLYHDSDHDTGTTQWVVDNIFPRLKKGSLVIFHDWAVEEINGKWVGKGSQGKGGWGETQLLMDLHEKGQLPLEKVYWNYHNPGSWELGVFLYV